MLHWIQRFRSRALVAAHDLCMVPIAWILAYWLRFNLSPMPHQVWHQAIITLPFLWLVQAICLWSFGLYRGVWRYASLPDLLRIIKAVAIASGSMMIGMFLVTRLAHIPRSVLPLYAMLMIFLLGGARFVFRVLNEYRRWFSNEQRVLIIGAGRAGESLVRDLLRDPQKRYQPVAFVDDSRRQRGREIQGIRVLGNTRDIPRLTTRYQIDLILIAVPTAAAKQMRRLVQYCENAQTPYRTLPSLNDLTAGRVDINAFREVSLDDLLGRDPVQLNWSAIQSQMSEQTILVTGGGGSIGSELCRQIAKLKPAKLIVLDKNEFNLYQLQKELSGKFIELDFQGYLIDVYDRHAVQHVLAQHKPSILFHAAAYKHVPLLEYQIREAAKNNILGTLHLAEAAIQFDVEHFVLISTDKAVNPTNIMGATKRAAENICQLLNRQSATQFITVRFGNVLGSAGSVVPLFRQQIEKGGPVTVTHPEITRFFMTIPEASQLILQAAAMGQGGEIFVLDMGEPIAIKYLAEQMIRLSGKPDISIAYTGLRAGEKLYEELFYKQETLLATSHQKIFCAKPKRMISLEHSRLMQRIQQSVLRYDEKELLIALKILVPNYQVEVPNDLRELSALQR